MLIGLGALCRRRVSAWLPARRHKVSTTGLVEVHHSGTALRGSHWHDEPPRWLPSRRGANMPFAVPTSVRPSVRALAADVDVVVADAADVVVAAADTAVGPEEAGAGRGVDGSATATLFVL